MERMHFIRLAYLQEPTSDICRNSCVYFCTGGRGRCVQRRLQICKLAYLVTIALVQHYSWVVQL